MDDILSDVELQAVIFCLVVWHYLSDLYFECNYKFGIQNVCNFFRDVCCDWSVIILTTVFTLTESIYEKDNFLNLDYL